jgi:hypothetical protein
MNYGDDELGGRHIGHVNIRVSGDEARARSYEGIARNILGTLKHQMQFNKLESGRTQPITLKDGTVIVTSSSKGVVDTDQIMIHSPIVPTPQEQLGPDRCLGFILQGFYQGPFSDFDVESGQGFFMLFTAKTPSGKFITRESDSVGAFDNYPDNGCKYGLPTTNMNYIYVADGLRTQDAQFMENPGPLTYTYSGPGNASYGLNPGWSLVRDAMYFPPGSCELGDAPLGGTRIVTADLTGPDGDVRSDVGYGFLYSGGYHPLSGSCGPDYPTARASGDVDNLRRGDFIAELVTLTNTKSAALWDETLAQFLLDYPPDDPQQGYSVLYNPNHDTLKNIDNKGVLTTHGFYIGQDTITLCDVREMNNDKSVGGGGLFVIPMKAESRRFNMSPYVIDKNTSFSSSSVDFFGGYEMPDYHWGNFVITGPGEDPFWGESLSPTWGWTSRFIDETTPGISLSGSASFQITMTTEETSSVINNNFGIPINVENGLYKVKMNLTAPGIEFTFDKVRIYLYTERQGVLIRDIPFLPYIESYPFIDVVTKDIHIRVGEYRETIEELFLLVPAESNETFFG